MYFMDHVFYSTTNEKNNIVTAISAIQIKLNEWSTIYRGHVKTLEIT